MLKIVFSAIFVLLFSFSLSGCFENGEELGEKDQKELEDMDDIIYEALVNAETEVDLSGFASRVSSDEVFDTIEQVSNVNPEIMYHKKSEYNTDGKLTIKYYQPPKTIRAHQEKVQKQVNYIVQNIVSDNMSDFQKVQAVHDHIIKNSRYCLNSREVGIEQAPESYSPYGVLVNGEGVCASYAGAMQLIMEEAGINCLYVLGEADNEGHAWNMVELGGDYYHLDLTWNDPLFDEEVAGEGSIYGESDVQYKYFNVTDEEIGVSHSWERSKYPTCNATRYNYYHYNDKVVYSPQKFTEKIRDAIQSKERYLTVKVESYNSFEYDVPETIKSLNENEPGLIKGNLKFKFLPPENKNIGVISIKFNYH